MDTHVKKQLNFTINKNIEVLIQQIEALIKQNQANVNILPIFNESLVTKSTPEATGINAQKAVRHGFTLEAKRFRRRGHESLNSCEHLLDEFYKNVLQSEIYLRNGVFAINFAKAATFLDHAFFIYSKQVDLLWDMSINSERRHLSYVEDSKEKAEAQKKLEEKAQKGRRGRRKKIPDEPKKEIDWKNLRLKIKKNYCQKAMANTTEFDYENELDIAEMDPSTLQSFKDIEPFKNWHIMYPEKYVRRPYVENNSVIELDEDCRFHNGNSAEIQMNFMFPEIQRKIMYNYTSNKKLDTIGCDIFDQVFEQYILKHGINPCDFNPETYQVFKKYLNTYLINGPEEANLAEQRKKLCPRRPSIVLTRLSDDVIQQHMKDDRATPGVSRDDSGYFEDMDAMELSSFAEEVERSAEQSNDDSIPKKSSESSMMDNTPDSKNEYQPKTKKRKKVNKENDELQPNKRLCRKEIFKWLKTTTVALKKFEMFFYKHYLTEEGEGEIEQPVFSSDEEDHEGIEAEPSETALNASQTSADSGFTETSFLTQTSEIDRMDKTQKNNKTRQNSIGLCADLHDELPPDFELMEGDETFRRYVQWKEHMREELNKYTQKDFDIHEYGTSIINKLSEGKPTRFSNVLEDDSTNNVARYFTAALQLVNTNNIQFTNWTQGDIASDFEIILLSRDRHHEHLDDYQAPSEELIAEKIKKLQNMSTNIDVPTQNTPNDKKHLLQVTSQKSYKRIKLGG